MFRTKGFLLGKGRPEETFCVAGSSRKPRQAGFMNGSISGYPWGPAAAHGHRREHPENSGSACLTPSPSKKTAASLPVRTKLQKVDIFWRFEVTFYARRLSALDCCEIQTDG